MGDTWSDAELDILVREALAMQDREGEVQQRTLARLIHDRRLLPRRSHAAIYGRVRELTSMGYGWWSNRFGGRQINVRRPKASPRPPAPVEEPEEELFTGLED